MKRRGGVLMHISSLPGKFGIGTLGKGAYDFVDFLGKCGFGVWQVLPIGPCDSFNSPYSGSSAFAGNIYFIDPENLYKKGLLTKSELDESVFENEFSSQYAELHLTRENLFYKAYGRITESIRKKIREFFNSNPRIYDYAIFCALKKKFGGTAWYEWETPVKLREKSVIEKLCAELADDIEFYGFLQYEFYSQWLELKEYANDKGISIIGDMPIYLAYDSADVWCNPDIFSLDDDLNLTHCAGVPPDYFCSDGQKWGNPLYRWDVLKKNDYDFWLDRIKNAATLFDSIRIDHFRAFSAYWEIPVNAPATEGKWKKGPGMDFFNEVKKACPDAQIIAEDLGDIDDDVRKLVKESGFPGMGVMQFAFVSDGNSPHLPHNYTENTVAYTGTHDNTTLLAWLWEANDDVRKYALDYCGFEGDWGQGGPESKSVRSVIRTLWQSGAATAIVPVQDLCGFGGDTCMNKPGVADGNWSFRLTYDAMNSIDVPFYSRLNGIYHRI